MHLTLIITQSNDLMKVKNGGRTTWKVRSWVDRGRTDVGLQVNVATKFLTMTSNICGFSVSCHYADV